MIALTAAQACKLRDGNGNPITREGIARAWRWRGEPRVSTAEILTQYGCKLKLCKRGASYAIFLVGYAADGSDVLACLAHVVSKRPQVALIDAHYAAERSANG